MTSKIHGRAPTARHTASKQQVFAFKTTFYDLWFISIIVLVLLNPSAAFDTIDHDILLTVLDRIGVRGDALCWLASYHTDRTEWTVTYLAEPDYDTSSIGQCFGSLLFTVCCAGLSDIFANHGVRYHVYAGDTQRYVDFPPNDSATTADRICRSVMDVKVWLASRYLFFGRSENRGYSVYNTEPPCSAATSSFHRHLWTQRHRSGQHTRSWRSSRLHFVDDRTRKPYLPDCLRPASLHSANTIYSNA